MNSKIIALLLYNPSDLNSEINGGVQICSQEFLEIIKNTVDELHYFKVDNSRAIMFRLMHKVNFDLYQSYAIKKYKETLISTIVKQKINHVFINKAELIKFSKLIKDANLPEPPKVIIMSHGNESGDLLGDLSGKTTKFNGILKYLGVLKLGIVLYLESWYRKRYVDLVCTMSDEESAIEKWLGMNMTFFIPRLIHQSDNVIRMPKSGVFGYVGTLSHTPNFVALNDLFSEIAKCDTFPEIRIVGQPAEMGENFAKQYAFVKYLGALKDTNLIEEVKNWSFFINPIFNYSRGASMKLAKAIEWQVPVITTIAGRRGYIFNSEKLIETEDNPFAMAKAINKQLNITGADYDVLQKNIEEIKQCSLTAKELGENLRKYLEKLTI